MNNITFPGLGIELTVNEIAIALPIAGGGIRWYSLIIVAGMLIAAWVCERELKRLGEKPDHIYDLVLWGLPAAIICARIYYVLFSLAEYKDNPLRVFAIWEGGIAIYGAIIGAFLTEYFCRVKKLKLLRYLDIGAYGFLIGQIIGRWGNFVNGEAFGTETSLPWRMSINGAAPVHPAFLYESLWNLAGFAYIWLTRKKRGFDGRALGLYMLWYGIGRFFIEGLRADSLMLGNLRASQLLSVFAILGGVVIFLISKSKHKLEREEAEDDTVKI